MTGIIPAAAGCRYAGSTREDHMIERLDSATVGEIVATDFRTAGVFERFGIDFCCGGRRSLAEACRTASADPDTVIRALQALPADRTDDDVSEWPLDRLIDHIESVHHAYVRAALPRIAGFFAKLVEVHDARHPELRLVASSFRRLAGELQQHMLKEEQVLFPYLRDLVRFADQLCMARSPFGSVQNPIRMMEREHREAGEEMQIIRSLTGNYVAPIDACTTYRVCLQELQEFEQDLHRHVHLENNVLFPKAVTLEEQ
jgi:regulator of cell morphogenesis and NO signaling